MKNLFLILFLFCSKILFAINEYSIGDKLFVWAEGGLSLREEAGGKSKAILIIPHGAKIEALQESNIGATKDIKVQIIQESVFTNEEDKTIKTFPLSLSGKWLKIKYKEKEGYVFDGFLSHLKVVDNFLDYFTRNYKLLEADTAKSYDRSYLFSKGHSFEHGAGDGSCWYSERVIFQGISLEEAILLAKYTCKAYSDGNSEPKIIAYKVIPEANMYVIEFAPYGTNGTLTLRYSGSIAQISYDDHT